MLVFNVIRIDDLVWASHNDKHDITYAAMDTIYCYGYHLSVDEESKQRFSFQTSEWTSF